jgi:hypothetical protein
MEEVIKDQFAKLIESNAPKYYHYFRAVGWTWWNTEPNPPTIKQIRETLYSLVDDLRLSKLNPDGRSVYTGGLEVGYAPIAEDGTVEVFVSFKDIDEEVVEDGY